MAKSKRASRTAETETVHIGELRRDPHQARVHTARGHGMLVDGIQKLGTGRSIVIDEDNTILAGEGVVEACAEAGVHDVVIVDADGDELVVVRRLDLTDEAREEMALLDNRAGELSGWDPDRLREMQAAGQLGRAFTAEEFAREMARLTKAAATAAAAATTPVPALPQPGEADRMKLVHIHVPQAQYDTVLETIRGLAAEYGTDTMTGTIMRMIEAEAAAIAH